MLEFGVALLGQIASGEDLGFLDYLNLGVLAVLAVGYTKMWIVPGRALEKAEAALAKKEQELSDLRTRIDTEVLPQLWRTADLLAQFARMDRDRHEES